MAVGIADGMAADNKQESKAHLVKNALLQRMLIRPQARVGGRQLLFQPWRQLIQAYRKLGHVVPADHMESVLHA